MPTRNCFVLLFFLTLLLPGCATQALTVAREPRIIYTTQLQALFEGGEKPMLLDARSKAEFDEAHLAGALNLQAQDLAERLSALPEDRKTPLVVYANGVQDKAGHALATRLEAAGYTDVGLYTEGLLVWEERGQPLVTGPGYGRLIETRGLSATELAGLLKSEGEGIVVVDVRDQVLYTPSHIPGAVNIPVEIFALGSEYLPMDKTIVVYCDTGDRSRAAYRKLVKLGYPKVYQARFDEWRAAGQPVVAASCH